jgi:asparagine synthase (glutamine-hydrolysing)
MCGFSGYFCLNKNYVNNKINTWPLDHRGPDDFQTFRNDFIKVNFYRLKILGGHHGRQPMISENKRWMIVFNGEIYNYIELAQEMKRPDLIKKGDTRVLLELLALKGMKAVKKINGMFSIVLFDLRKKKIFLIRDRFGTKPLYYKIEKNILYFGSEIKSLPLNDTNKINLINFREYIDSKLYPETPHTFFRNIYEIKPGTINELKQKKLKSIKYYSLEKNLKKLRNKNISILDFEKNFENSLKLRLRSDVPLSLHFSGGIDSTAIICKLKEMFGSKIPLKLYFIKYQNRINSELVRARKICKLLKLKLNEVSFQDNELKKMSKEIQFFMDEPFGGVPTIGMGKLNKFQKNKIPVSLEGQGSDEIFCGYYTHIIMALRDMINNKKDKKIFFKLKKNFKINNKQILNLSSLLIKNNFGGSTDGSNISLSKKKFVVKKTFLRSIEFFNIQRNKLPRVLRFHDRVSAGYSRELRFPFLDHNVVEIALSLKNEDKFKDGYPKYPLFKIIERHLPIKLFQIKKISDGVPQLEIIKKNKFWMNKILKTIKSKNTLNGQFIESVEKTLKNNKSKNSFHVWQLLNTYLFNNHIKNLKKNNK